MSFFSENNLPLTVLYSTVYQNISKQILEIEKALVPPGHLWSQFPAERYLIGDDYTMRGYSTQKLIDLGYIAKRSYSPIIPQGFLFLQSYQSTTWFQVDAVEVDVPSELAATREEVTFLVTDVTGPPEGSIINFNIQLPAGVWFVLSLDVELAVGMALDTNDDVTTFLYEKRDKLNWPVLSSPLAIPNTVSLIFDDDDGRSYRLLINDQGQLFWTLNTGTTPIILFTGNSLFWLTVTPILVEVPDLSNLNFKLGEPEMIRATFSGTYSGPTSGTLEYQWRATDLGSLDPGSYPIHSTSGSWTVSGTLTVSA